MKIEDKIKEMGIELPVAPLKGGIYTPIKLLGEKTYYISGCGTLVNNVGYRGKLGEDLSIKEGKKAALSAMLNFLSTIKANLCDLDEIESFVKLLVFVAGPNDFYQQPQVANGATQLLLDVFGEKIGLPTRSSVGVSSLPDNIPVEIEGIIRVK